MRFSVIALTLLCLQASQSGVNAGPLAPKDNDEKSWNNRIMKQLFGRQGNCDGKLCGYYNQLCCKGSEMCYTDLATQAHCSTAVPAETLGYNLLAPANPQWSYTTYTTTNEIVMTITKSSYVGQAPITSAFPVSSAQCAVGQIGCGANCCDTSYQTCGITPGVCVNIGTMTQSNYGAPTRPTSSGGVITTASATTTESFSPAIGTSGSTFLPAAESTKKGLSGGAIAGIVIGVIAGIILLLLICFCCILKAGFDGLLALFGLRNKRKTTERTEITEERYSRHGGSASRRDTHSGWFGAGGGRVTEKKKKKSGLGGETGIMVGIAAALAGLWAILGLRKKKKSGRSNASNVTYETYTESSYTGTSDSK